MDVGGVLSDHDFNSRPSARGDLGIPTVPCIRLISIHAPPRGATPCGCSFQRATHFNSRPSARGDWLDVGFNVSRPNISIHAPPRGATSRHAGRVHTRQFQFTPLREGRPPTGMSCRPAQNFNSRPSARGDAVAAALDALTDISIHAPPRGATCEERGSGDWQNISIHAPPRGATRSPWHPPPSARISIHAPPRGATAAAPRQRAEARYFNSRPSARGDRMATR